MYIFSFRSRTQTLKFYDYLISEGIDVRVINTPRAVSADCGLSVTVPQKNIDAAQRALGYESFDTFVGVFIQADCGIRRVRF